MQIKNHLIPGGLYKASPNISGALVNPSLLVMHYTASGRGAKGDADFLCTAAAKASAHVVVGADGDLFQIVPFDKRAWHAGVSTWRGVPNCNTYSIGIEVDNWGLLTKRADGTYRSHSGAIIPAENVVDAKNKRGVHGFWEAYPEKQLAALDVLVEAILTAYPSIREVVGHEDIAPIRKIDPGPAFPLARYENMVGGGRAAIRPAELRIVTASALNVRLQPNTSADLGGQLKRDTIVEVIYDAGDWAQIKVGGVTGWVYDQYLAPYEGNAHGK